MLINKLLNAAQYVTDKEGNRQAVLIEWDVWEELVSSLSEAEKVSVEGAHGNGDDREIAMAREEAAYRAMHQELLASYAGQYVAIYNGQLVDHDQDGTALYLRVRKQFPGEFVLIASVQPEPAETYEVYSPRLVSAV